MQDLIPINDPEWEEPRYAFDLSEDLIFWVEHDPDMEPSKYDRSWSQKLIHDVRVIRYDSDPDDIVGACSYDQSYGAGLDYVIRTEIEYPGDGLWVLEDVTAIYSQGDGWEIDDDMQFYPGQLRPATIEEIIMYFTEYF